MLTENIDYKYVFPSDNSSSVYIELLTGDFKDTVFKYGKVEFKEKNEKGYLQFDYNEIGRAHV